MSDFCYYIYAYVRKDRSPYYIGKGTGRRAFAPHGKHIAVPRDRSRIIIMERNLSEIGAIALERRYISWYGKKSNGGTLRNLTDGGEGMSGYRHTEEYKKKSSESRKGANSYWYGKKIPREYVERSRLARIGTPLSEEHKRKISEANKGRAVSEETKQKLRVANSGKTSWAKGKKFSDETRKRMSEARKGEKCCMYGTTMPDEVRAKISTAMSGKKQSLLQCPHCNKIGGSIMKRWHFNNCKSKE